MVLLRLELVADDCLDQPVHAQPLSVLAGLDQRVAPQRPDGLLVGERVLDGGGQPLWQQVGVLDGQVAGDVLGSQERTQAQQVLGGGGLLA